MIRNINNSQWLTSFRLATCMSSKAPFRGNPLPPFPPKLPHVIRMGFWYFELKAWCNFPNTQLLDLKGWGVTYFSVDWELTQFLASEDTSSNLSYNPCCNSLLPRITKQFISTWYISQLQPILQLMTQAQITNQSNSLGISQLQPILQPRASTNHDTNPTVRESTEYYHYQKVIVTVFSQCEKNFS